MYINLIALIMRKYYKCRNKKFDSLDAFQKLKKESDSGYSCNRTIVFQNFLCLDGGIQYMLGWRRTIVLICLVLLSF